MITWNWFDTHCKNKWAIFTRLISLTGPLQFMYQMDISNYNLTIYLFKTPESHIKLCSNSFERTRFIVSNQSYRPIFTTPQSWVSWRISYLSYNVSSISSPKFGTPVFFILILPTPPSYSNAMLLRCDNIKDLAIEFVICSKLIEQTNVFFIWNTVFNLFSIGPAVIF